jgi:hypothetical protein
VMQRYGYAAAAQNIQELTRATRGWVGSWSSD